MSLHHSNHSRQNSDNDNDHNLAEQEPQVVPFCINTTSPIVVPFTHPSSYNSHHFNNNFRKSVSLSRRNSISVRGSTPNPLPPLRTEKSLPILSLVDLGFNKFTNNDNNVSHPNRLTGDNSQGEEDDQGDQIIIIPFSANVTTPIASPTSPNLSTSAQFSPSTTTTGTTFTTTTTTLTSVTTTDSNTSLASHHHQQQSHFDPSSTLSPDSQQSIEDSIDLLDILKISAFITDQQIDSKLLDEKGEIVPFSTNVTTPLGVQKSGLGIGTINLTLTQDQRQNQRQGQNCDGSSERSRLGVNQGQVEANIDSNSDSNFNEERKKIQTMMMMNSNEKDGMEREGEQGREKISSSPPIIPFSANVTKPIEGTSGLGGGMERKLSVRIGNVKNLNLGGEVETSSHSKKMMNHRNVNSSSNGIGASGSRRGSKSGAREFESSMMEKDRLGVFLPSPTKRESRIGVQRRGSQDSKIKGSTLYDLNGEQSGNHNQSGGQNATSASSGRLLGKVMMSVVGPNGSSGGSGNHSLMGVRRGSESGRASPIMMFENGTSSTLSSRKSLEYRLNREREVVESFLEQMKAKSKAHVKVVVEELAEEVEKGKNAEMEMGMEQEKKDVKRTSMTLTSLGVAKDIVTEERERRGRVKSVRKMSSVSSMKDKEKMSEIEKVKAAEKMLKRLFQSSESSTTTTTTTTTIRSTSTSTSSRGKSVENGNLKKSTSTSIDFSEQPVSVVTNVSDLVKEHDLEMKRKMRQASRDRLLENSAKVNGGRTSRKSLEYLTISEEGVPSVRSIIRSLGSLGQERYLLMGEELFSQTLIKYHPIAVSFLKPSVLKRKSKMWRQRCLILTRTMIISSNLKAQESSTTISTNSSQGTNSSIKSSLSNVGKAVYHIHVFKTGHATAEEFERLLLVPSSIVCVTDDYPDKSSTSSGKLFVIKVTGLAYHKIPIASVPQESLMTRGLNQVYGYEGQSTETMEQEESEKEMKTVRKQEEWFLEFENSEDLKVTMNWLKSVLVEINQPSSPMTTTMTTTKLMDSGLSPESAVSNSFMEGEIRMKKHGLVGGLGRTNTIGRYPGSKNQLSLQSEMTVQDHVQSEPEDFGGERRNGNKNFAISNHPFTRINSAFPSTSSKSAGVGREEIKSFRKEKIRMAGPGPSAWPRHSRSFFEDTISEDEFGKPGDTLAFPPISPTSRDSISSSPSTYRSRQSTSSSFSKRTSQSSISTPSAGCSSVGHVGGNNSRQTTTVNGRPRLIPPILPPPDSPLPPIPDKTVGESPISVPPSLLARSPSQAFPPYQPSQPLSSLKEKETSSSF